MRSLIYLVAVLLSTAAFGQYTLDERIENNAFVKALKADPDPERRSILQVYYAPGVNLLQEQLKDTLRAKFNDRELFDIAQYSKMPFWRIAAFELYSQTNYDEDVVIQFLKRGRIPSSWSTPKDSVPELYFPAPTMGLPIPIAIRFMMLEILNPGAVIRSRENLGAPVIYVRTYPKSKALDLERFVSLQAYLKYYVQDRISGAYWASNLKPGEKKPKTPTFYISEREVDFGTIDLAYLNPAKSDFELRGAIKVLNNTSKPITLMGQASAHTMCLQGKYVIPAKQEMMIEFKSLVAGGQPQIHRSITLTNVETGGVQMFTFKATFIHSKT